MKNQNNNEVFIEETFNASRERVFNAWTEPDKLMKWFAPEGCKITFKQLDIKTGGSFHSCIINPQYGDCWCKGAYLEIIPHEKIVFSMANTNENGQLLSPADLGMDPEWPAETLVTVTFEDLNGKTKMCLWQNVPDELAKKTGAYHGWVQMFGILRNLLD